MWGFWIDPTNMTISNRLLVYSKTFLQVYVLQRQNAHELALLFVPWQPRRVYMSSALLFHVPPDSGGLYSMLELSGFYKGIFFVFRS